MQGHSRPSSSTPDATIPSSVLQFTDGFLVDTEVSLSLGSMLMRRFQVSRHFVRGLLARD
jgi:hypothetical protein